VVVIRVEDDLDVVRRDVAVAPDQLRVHAGRAAVVEHARAHVDGRLVEREPHLGALRGRLAFVRLVLTEIRRGRRRLPYGIVEPPVKLERARERDGPDLGRRREVDGLSGGARGGGGEHGECHLDERGAHPSLDAFGRRKVAS
jgi:hypothetical protein